MTSINISINSIKYDSSSSNVSLYRSDQERILGIIVDKKTIFRSSYGLSCFNRSLSAMDKIRDFSMQHLGLQTKLALLLYITNVRSWSTINEDQLHRLESVQGMMLKIIFNSKAKSLSTLLTWKQTSFPSNFASSKFFVILPVV